MNGSTTPAARAARDGRMHPSALGVTVPPRVLFLLFRGSPSHDPFALSPRDPIVIARGGRACPRFTARAVAPSPGVCAARARRGTRDGGAIESNSTHRGEDTSHTSHHFEERPCDARAWRCARTACA